MINPDHAKRVLKHHTPRQIIDDVVGSPEVADQIISALVRGGYTIVRLEDAEND